ncbi:MAG: photosystem II protein Psb27 [Coleofasciculus sp. G3-WIS-01]|uniref:photosystem II protein Psb27 n=1 Tax=Coleofasciculus sp. G3-WIS-01 TaxID=3069528 RepID=UPI0032F88E95
MKRYLSRLVALVLVAAIALTGCSSSSTGLVGNYSQDTLTALDSLRAAIELPDDAPDKAEAQSKARQSINEYISRYRRDSSVANLSSFSTMRTALNSLAGYYSSYPNRPLPQKLKDRLEQEFRQVERAIRRGA